jgi:predicted CoA-binding protein
MRRHGYRVIPVNPNETSVFGEKAYPDLSAVPEKIELVDVFRRSDEAGKAVGVIDGAAAQRALDAGLLVVMDRCWLKEHIRHG